MMSWFSRTATGEEPLRCARCNGEFAVDPPSIDHHPSTCPKCGVECLLFSFPRSHLQIVVGDAPKELAAVIRWTQEHFDELDFLVLVTAIRQIAENDP